MAKKIIRTFPEFETIKWAKFSKMAGAFAYLQRITEGKQESHLKSQQR